MTIGRAPSISAEAVAQRIVALMAEEPRADGWTQAELAPRVERFYSQLQRPMELLRYRGMIEPVTERYSSASLYYGAPRGKRATAYRLTDRASAQ
jgi:hypothetical protein